MATPLIRVDHIAIAVRDMDRALDFFLKNFPVKADIPITEGYDGSFRWTDFNLGHFKIELIDSAKPGSFVERFISRHGEGLHHFALDIDGIDELDDRLVARGHRVVDRFDHGDGRKTFFIHPHSAFGALIQFWQKPASQKSLNTPSWGSIAERDGVRWQVDHLGFAVREIDPARQFFEEFLSANTVGQPQPASDNASQSLVTQIGDYRIELLESTHAGSPVDRFLSERGPGMHHLSIDVEDLDTVLASLKAVGVRTLERQEFGPDGKVAFLHPQSMFGVLIRLRETSNEHF